VKLKILNKLLIIFLSVALPSFGVSQVVLDDSFGNEGVLEGPDFKIPDNLGMTVGGNLFHSFEVFSIDTDHSATFSGPRNIKNIVTRVTGGNISYIDGLIKSEIVDSNLYLINPNGFIFGENSEINIDGSFIVSTHDGIQLGESKFYSSDPDKSLLVISDGESFGFLGGNPLGNIVLDGSSLSVSGVNESFILAANQISLENEAYLGSENGGDVGIIASDLSVVSGSGIETSSKDSDVVGDINIESNSILLDKGGTLFAGTSYNAKQPRGPRGGNINILADEILIKSGAVSTTSQSLARAGNINIYSDKLVVGGIDYDEGEWEAYISADTQFVGALEQQELINSGVWTIDGGGDIKIDSEEIDIVNGGVISSITTGQGDAGSITLNVQKLNLIDQAVVATYTEFRPKDDLSSHIKGGNGGDLIINAENILFDSVSLELGTWGTGDSGISIINAQSMYMEYVDLYGDSYGLGYESYRPDLESVFELSPDTWLFATGKGPELTFNINNISLSESSIDLRSTGAGDGGLLNIISNNLTLDNSSNISSLSAMTGNAGRINIETKKLNVLGDSKIETSTEYRATNLEDLSLSGGLGGDLSIYAQEIHLVNSSIDVGTKGSGNSGLVELRSDLLIMNESEINGNTSGVSYVTDLRPESDFEFFEVLGDDTWQFATGDGPALNLEIQNIEIINGSSINIEATGMGDAGTLSIKSDILKISGNSKISTETTKSGSGGQIFIDADQILISDESEFITSTKYIVPLELKSKGVLAGQGGALILHSKNLEISEQSGMELGTYGEGNSGPVFINSNKIKISNESYINGDVYPFSSDDGFEEEFDWQIVSGNGPDIIIESNEILLEQSSSIDITTEAAGNAGFLKIQTDSLGLIGMSSILSSSSKTGKGGYLLINTGDLFLERMSLIETATTFRASSPDEAVYKGGLGGNLTINAENIIMRMSAMELGTWGSGNSGLAEITANSLSLLNGSTVYGDSFGLGDNWQYSTGNGPSISIDVEAIHIDGESSIDMKSTGAGNAGYLNIKSETLNIENDSKISSKSSMTGHAGAIEIDSKKIIIANGGAIETFTEFRPISLDESGMIGGNGGNLIIDAHEINMQGARMEIGTWGSGKSGDARIFAEKMILDDKSIISGDVYGLGYRTEDREGVELLGAQTWMHASGAGPNLLLEINEIYLENYSGIDMKSTGSGNAGKLNIQAEELFINNNSFISSKSSMTGNAGKISIDAQKLSLNKNGRIEAFTEFRPVLYEEKNIMGGNGGDLVVNAVEVSLNSSKMELGTMGNGNGGSVNINAETFSLRDSSINADTMGYTYKTLDRGSMSAIEDSEIDIIKYEVLKSDNNFHFAIDGNGFFEVISPWGDGQKGYTRAGKFKKNDNGYLVTNQGFELDIGIGQIPSGGGISVNLEGKYTIYDPNGGISSTGQIQISRFQNPDALENVGMNVYIPTDDSGDPDYGKPLVNGFGGVKQGFHEKQLIKFNNIYEIPEDSWSNVTGRGGELSVNVNSLQVLEKSRLNLKSTSAGDVGTISIHSYKTEISGESILSTESKYSNGGMIKINSVNELKVNNSEITTQAKIDGGEVKINSSNFIFFRDSFISAEAGQDGGNILLDYPDNLVLQRSQLSANAKFGNGGYILISANGYLPSTETIITASSEFGLMGKVEIQTPNTDIGSGLVGLVQTLGDRDVRLAERCALRLSGDVSSLFLNSNGGLPIWSNVNYADNNIIFDKVQKESAVETD